MKRFSRALSIFLTICLLFGVAVIASASAPEDKTEKIRNYDFEESTTIPGTSNGNGAANYRSLSVVSAKDNNYLRFAHIANSTKSYTTAFLVGANNPSTSNYKSGTNLKNYDFVTVDFDLAADGYLMHVGYDAVAADTGYTIEKVYKAYHEINEDKISEDIVTAFSNFKSSIKSCIDAGFISDYATAEDFLRATEYVSDSDAETLSSSITVKSAIASKKLSYSDGSYFSLDTRPIIYKSDGTVSSSSAATTQCLRVTLNYNENDFKWHFSVKNTLGGDVVTNSGNDFVLANGLGEWNHFTYAVRIDHNNPAKSMVYLYYNGFLIGRSCISRNATYHTYTEENINMLTRGVEWAISKGTIDYSMAFDNFVSTYYVKDYRSDNYDGIDDLFDENSSLKSVSQCDDVVYNVDYVSPAPNKYVELDGKKVYVPALVGDLFHNIKNGEVVNTEIDLIGIDPPAWTSFSIKCDTDRIVTLSNKAIARGTTIKKTADGYRIDSGIMANMSLFTDMRFNLYLPKTGGVKILSVSNAKLAETTYWVNGNEMYLISATPKINSFDPIKATVKYSMDGNEYELDILLDILKYTTIVADLYECGSEESRLVYEIIRYKEAAAAYIDPDF